MATICGQGESRGRLRIGSMDSAMSIARVRKRKWPRLNVVNRLSPRHFTVVRVANFLKS